MNLINSIQVKQPGLISQTKRASIWFAQTQRMRMGMNNTWLSPSSYSSLLNISHASLGSPSSPCFHRRSRARAPGGEVLSPSSPFALCAINSLRFLCNLSFSQLKADSERHINLIKRVLLLAVERLFLWQYRWQRCECVCKPSRGLCSVT